MTISRMQGGEYFKSTGPSVTTESSRLVQNSRGNAVYLAHLHRPKEGALQESIDAVDAAKRTLLQSSHAS